MSKRLTKSNNKVIFGLMAGIAEYFETDPVLVRLLYFFITVFTGVFPGIIAYIVGALFVPEAPSPSAPIHDAETV